MHVSKARRLLVSPACVMVSVLLTSCTIPGERLSTEEAREARTSAPYAIGARDILEVQVENHPELSGQFVVERDGTIPLPYCEDDVLMSGCTLRAAGERYAECVSRYTIDWPIVRVRLVSPRSKFFYVLGAVKRTGKFALGDEVVRLRDALLRAGLFDTSPWFKPAARKIYVITPDEETSTYVVINARDVLLGKLGDDIVIHPDDIVYVPTTSYFKIDSALGEILRTTIYVSDAGAAEEHLQENRPEDSSLGYGYQ